MTFSPNWMAITIARTEPKTLEAAFIAQAHSTAFWLASSFCAGGNSGAGTLARTRRPVPYNNSTIVRNVMGSRQDWRRWSESIARNRLRNSSCE